jgi:Ca-activated chloride channel family protein
MRRTAPPGGIPLRLAAVWGVAALFFVLSPVRPALEGQGSRVFRSGIEVVHVTATVLDEHGRLVTGLSKNAFEIQENGVAQDVTQFTGERVPVSLALLLDVSDSMFGPRIAHARLALRRFVGGLLDPLDEACLVTFNHRPKVVAPWTIGPASLGGALDALKPFGGTAIYDALMAALPLMDGRHHQRAAMIVISDGADTASEANLQDVRALQWRSDAFVYAIALDPPNTVPINSRVNPEALRDITDPSGGYTEVVRDDEELGAATARIAEELNHQYLLGYTPQRPPEGDYRRIRVRVKDHPYVVRARRGYVAVPPRQR